MATVQGAKRCTLVLRGWMAGWKGSMPPSTRRHLWNGSRMSAEFWFSAAAATSSCMDTYGETATKVRADTPPLALASSYAMNACAMCLYCVSTWLLPPPSWSRSLQDDEEEDNPGVEALMRSSAEARPANSMRCSACTDTGDWLDGDAMSRSVRSPGTSRGAWTHASTRSSVSNCNHPMVRRL
jgi:hypothetical protein